MGEPIPSGFRPVNESPGASSARRARENAGGIPAGFRLAKPEERVPVPVPVPSDVPTPKAEEPGWLDWLQGGVERVGLATGLIDDSTYYGLGNYGADAVKPQGPTVAKAPAPRGNLALIGDTAANMFSQAGEGVNAFVLRTNQLERENDLIRATMSQQGASAQEIAYEIARNEAKNAAAVRETRAQRQIYAADDEARQGDQGWSAWLGRRGSELLGGMLGDVNPTYAIAPGANALQRIGAQAGVNAGTDAAIQGVELDAGIMDEFDFARLGLNAVTGAAFQGLVEVPGAVRNFRQPGAVDDVPDADLLDVTLDADDPVAMATRELADFQGYAQTVRGQNPILDMALDREAAQLYGNLQAAQAQLRAVPEMSNTMPQAAADGGATIIGAAEGNVLANDVGGIAGLMRERVANSEVFDRAAERAQSNPTLKAILDSTANTQQMTGALWKRLAEVDASGAREVYPRPELDLQLPEQIETLPAEVPYQSKPSPSAMAGLPVEGRISSTFGRRKSPKAGASTDHNGADIAASIGTPINVRADGDVTFVGDAGKSGRVVRIDHGNGITTAYAHMDGFNVSVGQRVKAGQKIGTVGNTGNSTGPHLHYVVRKNGKAVDPQKFTFPNAVRSDAGEVPNAAEPALRVQDEIELKQRRKDAGEIDFGEERYRGFENTSAPESPTRRQIEEGTTDYTAPLQTGDSTKAFPDTRDDPAGNQGFWEERANMQAEDLRRAWEQANAEQAQSAGARPNSERASDDVSGKYAKYDQKPVKDGDFWRFTDDGYVAGSNRQPVAFQTAKEAAKFAAAEKLGGDVEPVVWKANSTRIVLRRRDGSTYGQAAPAAEAAAAPQQGTGFKRTEFERQDPPAGRSEDDSQRTLPNGLETPPEEVSPSTARTAEFVPQRQNNPAGGEISDGPPAEQVVTSTGTKIDTRFEVVNAADLITSESPKFNQRYQPRDRSNRSASDAQIADIASKLDPEQLRSSRLASQGAPIVGPDLLVESGNGRTAAIRRAYEQHPERAAEYRSMVERMGFNTEGMQQPVLIRRRETQLNDAERVAFTRDAQGGGTMDMSPTEKAKADARAVPRETMAQYRGGDINSAANLEFRKSFMAKVVSADERNALQMSDGSLSKTGVDRIRGAMLHRAYEDPRLVEKLLVDEETEIKAIGNVLTDLAPGFAQLKDRVAAGEVPPAYDITPQVAEISSIIARSRAESRPVTDFIDQTDIFAGDIDPITEALAGIMLKGEGLTKARSAKDISDGLNQYLRDAGDAAPDLLGGDMTARALETIQAAREMLLARDRAKGETTGNLFDRPGRPGRGKVTADYTRSLSKELSSVTGEYAVLAKKLADIVGDDATVTYGSRNISDLRRIGEAEPETGRAFVRDAGDTETLLHEAIHVAAVSRYGYEFDNLRAGDLAETPAREFLTLFNEARERAGRGFTLGHSAKYALSSPDEFLSMALTNRATQRWLDRGSLWDRFTDGVRKLLGLDAKIKPMLNSVLKASNEILDAAKTDPVRLQEGRRLGMPGKEGGLLDLVDGEGLKRDAALVKKIISSPIQSAKDAIKPMGEFISAAAFSNDARLRSLADRFDSDALRELADHFHARSGKDDATTRTYHEAVSRRSSGQMQQAFDALEQFSAKPASLKRIRDLLSNPSGKGKATASELAAASKLRDLLKAEISYRKDAGEDIGEVTDGYFPRVMDVEKAVKNRDKWLQQAEKLYTREGAENPKEAAAAWFERVFDQYAGVDGGLDFLGHKRSGVGGMGSTTAKAREFGKNADKLMADFYSEDVTGTLAAYFSGTARRAEYMRRFGMDGRQGSKERAAWVDKHGEKTKLDVLNDRITVDLRGSEEDAGGALHTINSVIASNLGRMGGGISTGARNAISYVHAWNQLAKLDRTTITSLTELSAGLIRSGSARQGLRFVGDSLYQFGRQVANAKPDDAKRWAEALGVSQDAMVNQMLLSRAGIDLTTTGTQKTMAGFYRGIGLHQYTEATRIAAVKMGRKYIDTLAHDMGSSTPRVKKRAEYYLKELGVADPAKFAAAIRDGGPDINSVRNDEAGTSAEYATALVRFADQTIIMPNRAVKPTLANHPVGSLFYSLLSWSYGFKKNVLDRTARLAVEGVKRRDMGMLAPAAGLAVLALWSDFLDSELRPFLFGSSYDFESETPTEHALRVADRSGVFGPMSPVLNAVKGLKYNRSLAESISGPALGTGLASAEKVLTASFGRNSSNTNTAERNAANAIYEAVLEPAVDAYGAARLKGAARTAVIMGTGNKEGGVLPGDKDWFVDTVAGEKMK